MCNYGDLLPTHYTCEPYEMMKEIKQFDDKWQKFNPGKPHILRDGLSVTSLDGKFGGPDLDSLKDVMERTGEIYYEASFDQFTPVYDASEELQNIIEPWKPWIGRSHFIKIPPGGYFPTHCDGDRVNEPEVFRIILPVKNCNPPQFFFMFGGAPTMSPIYWEEGRSYFMNTHKPHCLFNCSVWEESIMLILNIKVCEESVRAMKFAVYF